MERTSANKLFCLLLMLLLPFTNAMAEHIFGGTAGYRYLGYNEASNTWRYEITFTVYVDRNSQNYENGEQAFIYYGIYSAADGSQTISDVLYTSTRDVTPPIPEACDFNTLQNTGIVENTYRVEVDLPADPAGYYVFSERCCRSSAVGNIANVGESGNVFYTYIPSPATLPNSTPVFADEPDFLVCSGNPFTVINTMIDPDGDSLVYAFDELFNGVTASPFDPAPFAPATLPPVASFERSAFALNHSLQAPFGPGSSAEIDPATGLTTYFSDNVGLYVVNIKVQEYRQIDGAWQLINESWREIQIVVADCPDNEAPGLALPPDQTTSEDTLYVTRQENFCIDFTLTDPEGDSVYLEFESNILDGSGNYTGPLASVADTSGLGTTTSSFCWQPDCETSGVYQLVVKGRDNGCPPREFNRVYKLVVRPPVNPPVFTVQIAPQAACAGETLAASADVPVDEPVFAWYRDDVLLEGLTSAQIVADTAGTYRAEVQYCGYTYNETASVNPVPPPPEVAPPAAGCARQALQPLQAAAEGQVLWFADEQLTDLLGTGNSYAPSALTDTTRYWVVQRIEDCASEAVEVMVPVNLLPVVELPAAGCVQEPLVATTQGQSALQLQWLRNGQELEGETGEQLLPDASGEYFLRATLNGCDTLAGPVVVSDYPALNLAGPAEACFGDTVTWSAETGGALEVNWYQDEALTLLVHQGATFTLAAAGAPQQFWVQASNGTCTSPAESVSLEVFRPEASFEVPSATVQAEVPVTFINTSQQGNTWLWDFGDGNTSVARDGVHVYASPGVYQVQLTAYHNASCFDVSEVLEITVFSEIVIPNAISPNGDGANDRWIIENLGFYQDHLLRVYNQWGNIVFESLGYQNDWDGENLPDGTYFYTLEFPLQQIESIKGYLEIRRR